MGKITEIRCPFKRRTVDGKKIVPCNRLILKVYAGSKGEAYCRACRLEFDFEVDSQSNYRPRIEVKREKAVSQSK